MTLQTYFSSIEDPRQQHKIKHELIDVLVLSIIAIICGANEYKEIVIFGRAKESFLKQFLSLHNGIPSHDTIERVLSIINPKEFHYCFCEFTKSLCKNTEGLISIDGKTSRSSYDSYHNKSAIHLVNAWSTANSVVLAQYKVDDKSNEITAIPELLSLLQVEGAIISIDAMGCQKAIAKAIIEAKADYIFGLKGNQKTLEEEAVNLFSHTALSSKDETFNYTGNRIETRICSVLNDLNLLDEKENWPSLKSIIRIESIREIGDKKSSEIRYYASSTIKTAKEFNGYIRSHWQIENNLHWQLDVTFCEDASRKRKGNSAEVFSVLSKTALNILKTSTTDKQSLANKRYKASLDENYLLKIIGFSCV